MNQLEKNHEAIVRLKKEGVSTLEIAKQLGVAKSGLFAYVKKLNLNKKPGKPGPKKGFKKQAITTPEPQKRPMVAFIGTSQEITETIKQLFS